MKNKKKPEHKIVRAACDHDVWLIVSEFNAIVDYAYPFGLGKPWEIEVSE